MSENQIGYHVQKFVLCVKVSFNKKNHKSIAQECKNFIMLTYGNKGATNDSKAHKMTSRIARSYLPIIQPKIRLIYAKYVYTKFIYARTP